MRGLHNRIDGRVRECSVTALPFDVDVHAIDVGQNVSRLHADLARRHVAADVQREGILRLGKASEEAVLQHRLGPATDLFRRLPDEHHGPAPLILVQRQIPRNADLSRNVNVVPAGMHHPDIVPFGIFGLHRGSERQPGGFHNRQRVQIRSQHDDGTVSILEQPHDSAPPDARRHFCTDGLQLRR